MNNRLLPVLGVDVGGTKILTGLVAPDGTVLKSRRTPMDRSTTQSTLDSIRTAVTEFVATLAPDDRFAAAGFGLVGRCDVKNGIWVRADNLPIPSPIPLAAQMEELLGVPAAIDNDVFSATAAELAFGAGRQHRDFLLVNAGTGLSAGIVMDGKILRGAGNVAGEIGQTTMGLRDWQGNLEQCCSGGGIYNRSDKQRFADTRAIFEAAQAGDPEASALVSQAAESLGEALAGLVSIFNPSAVVLAGSVACNPMVKEAVAHRIRTRAYRSALMDLKEVTVSQLLPGTVGLVGAAQAARIRLGLE